MLLKGGSDPSVSPFSGVIWLWEFLAAKFLPSFWLLRTKKKANIISDLHAPSSWPSKQSTEHSSHPTWAISWHSTAPESHTNLHHHIKMPLPGCSMTHRSKASHSWACEQARIKKKVPCSVNYHTDAKHFSEASGICHKVWDCTLHSSDTPPQFPTAMPQFPRHESLRGGRGCSHKD